MFLTILFRLLKGRSFPGKVLITRRTDPPDESILRSPDSNRSFHDNDSRSSEQLEGSLQDEHQSRGNASTSSSLRTIKISTSSKEDLAKGVQKAPVGARATNYARLMKFLKELSGTTVILDDPRELAWSGVPPYLRPNCVETSSASRCWMLD